MNIAITIIHAGTAMMYFIHVFAINLESKGTSKPHLFEVCVSCVRSHCAFCKVGANFIQTIGIAKRLAVK